jgi:hypothetical protein
VDQGVNLSRPGRSLRHPVQTPCPACVTACLTVTQGPKSLGITGPSLPLDTPLVHLGQAGATPEGGKPAAAYQIRSSPMGRPNESEASRVLSNLHTDLAWHLKSRLDDGSISTAELNILRQFLKDNGISAQPVVGTSFGDLVASLPDMDKIVQMPRRKAA